MTRGEYINKAELIKRILGHINRFAEEKNFSMNEGLKYAQGVIGGMPTFAVPEREKGEWKKTYLDHVAMGERPSILYCSVCHQCIAYPTNYCPNCGADMRGGEV